MFAPEHSARLSGDSALEPSSQAGQAHAALFDEASKFVAAAAESFLYSAAQMPVSGAVQLADQVCGSDLYAHTQWFSAPQPAQFGSLAWHAQQIGGGLGMVVDFLVASRLTKGALSQLVAEQTAAALSATRLGAVESSALTGAIYQGVFTPVSPDAKNFWGARLAGATTGAITFAALSATGIGLRSTVGTAGVESGLFTRFVKSDLALGTLSGFPAGIINAETSSLLTGNGLATEQQTAKGAYSFVVAGGPLALLHAFAACPPVERPDSSHLRAAVKADGKTDGKTEGQTDVPKSPGVMALQDELGISLERLPASDKTITQWDKTWWKVFDQLDIRPNKIDLTTDASSSIESKETKMLTLKRQSRVNKETVDTTDVFDIYRVKGSGTEVLLPAQSSERLEQVRSLRRFAATLTAEQRRDFNALMRQTEPAYHSAILPEQIPLLLRELPDPAVVKRLVLWPDKAFKAAGDAASDGTVNIYDYGKFDVDDLRHILFHEWSHQADNHDKTGAAFTYATILEGRSGYYSRPYAREDNMENLAVHLGEEMLSPDADRFFMVTKMAPLRSVVMAEILKERLDSAVNSGHELSPYHQQFVGRLKHMDEVLVPAAKEVLRKHLNDADPDQSMRALLFLKELRTANLSLAQGLVAPQHLLSLSNADTGVPLPDRVLNSASSSEEQFNQLLDAAAERTYLLSKLKDMKNPDMFIQSGSYERLWTQAGEGYKEVLAAALQRNTSPGSPLAAGALEFLWRNPEAAMAHVAPSALRALIAGEDGDLASRALSVYSQPSYMQSHGLAPDHDLLQLAKASHTSFGHR